MLIPPEWVQNVIRNNVPLIYGCSNGFVFDNQRSISELSFYNNSISHTIDKDYYEYGATEGCIIDMSLLLSVPLFKLDKRFILSFDELWLSFYVSHVLGFTIKKINDFLSFKVSEDINDFRSNVDFVESSRVLLINLVDIGFIGSLHLNINSLNSLLIDEIYYNDCAKNYTTHDFLPLVKDNKDEINIVIQFYYNNYNELINNISYHTVQNYCLKINCNLKRVDMTGFGKGDLGAKIAVIENIAKSYKRIFLIDGAVYINNSCPNLFTSIDNNKISCAFRGSTADLGVILFNSPNDLYIAYTNANTNIFNRISDDFNYPIDINDASETYKEKLRSKNIINMAFLTDMD
jgi:hypothetical protein